MATPRMATIYDCPAEIITHVAELLELDDLRALRLTCRAVEAKAQHFFERRFFATKTVYLVKSSLRELVALSHSRYSGFVRKLVVEFEDSVVINVLGGLDAVLQDNESVDAADEHSSCVYCYNAYVCEKRETFRAGLHLDLLAEAFGAFNIKAVELSDCGQGIFAENIYRLRDEASEVSNPDLIPHSRHCRCGTLRCTSTASDNPLAILAMTLARNGSRIEELALRLTPLQDIFNLDASILQSLTQSMEGLQKLSFACDIAYNTDHYHRTLMPWAPNIRSLTICDVYQYTRCLLFEMVAPVDLEELVLVNSAIHGQTFNAVLREDQAATLKVVKLQDIWLDGCNWMDIVRTLAECDSLEKVLVHAPYWDGIRDPSRLNWFCNGYNDDEDENLVDAQTSESGRARLKKKRADREKFLQDMFAAKGKTIEMSTTLIFRE
ncbi:hypothetical protein BDV95DRAFT_253161 [Massariosphaeria phaeospora]|uniref:F-box domain-containing protein n=1 Tax=Massariosphaeria phaeospora TaxID=100035 RepID=A0A7C8HYV0_9PLEO|nr:hypothetical protein BDV95DRAFT_253161 [Massariosphaeria phaeospora]